MTSFLPHDVCWHVIFAYCETEALYRAATHYPEVATTYVKQTREGRLILEVVRQRDTTLARSLATHIPALNGSPVGPRADLRIDRDKTYRQVEEYQITKNFNHMGLLSLQNRRQPVFDLWDQDIKAPAVSKPATIPLTTTDAPLGGDLDLLHNKNGLVEWLESLDEQESVPPTKDLYPVLPPPATFFSANPLAEPDVFYVYVAEVSMAELLAFEQNTMSFEDYVRQAGKLINDAAEPVEEKIQLKHPLPDVKHDNNGLERVLNFKKIRLPPSRDSVALLNMMREKDNELLSATRHGISIDDEVDIEDTHEWLKAVFFAAEDDGDSVEFKQYVKTGKIINRRETVDVKSSK